MSVSTIEGYVENGQIRLPQGANLPERARVYVVIPDVEIVMDVTIPNKTLHLRSPRLADPAQAAVLRKTMVIEERP